MELSRESLTTHCLSDTECCTNLPRNQLGVMVGLLLRLHYHTPKDSNLVGTFEPYTGHVIPYQPHSLTSQN